MAIVWHVVIIGSWDWLKTFCRIECTVVCRVVDVCSPTIFSKAENLKGVCVVVGVWIISAKTLVPNKISFIRVGFRTWTYPLRRHNSTHYTLWYVFFLKFLGSDFCLLQCYLDKQGRPLRKNSRAWSRVGVREGALTWVVGRITGLDWEDYLISNWVSRVA